MKEAYEAPQLETVVFEAEEIMTNMDSSDKSE